MATLCCTLRRSVRGQVTAVRIGALDFLYENNAAAGVPISFFPS
jgi:hypothetical protein